MRELRTAARPFPDVPVVVLSAARGFPRRFRAHWTHLQAELAAAAPQGRHVVVDGSGHQIPMDRPDAVADTILAVATQTRASSEQDRADEDSPAQNRSQAAACQFRVLAPPPGQHDDHVT
jgi:hypothetical protein